MPSPSNFINLGYKGLLASNFKKQQENNKKMTDYLSGVDQYLKSFNAAQENLIDTLNKNRKSGKTLEASEITINMSETPGISRWDKPKVQGQKSRESNPQNIAGAGNIVFNTSIVTDASPAEKDKIRYNNQKNQEIADRMADSLEQISKNTKKKTDQDTKIKKNLAQAIKDSGGTQAKEMSKTQKMMDSVKSAYKKISAKLPDFNITSMANKMLGMYYKFMEYMIAYEITKTFAKLGIKSFKVFSYISTMPIRIVKNMAQGGWKVFNYLSSVNVSGFLRSVSTMPRKTWEGVKFFFKNPKKAISITIKEIFSSKEGFKTFLKSGPKAPGWLTAIGIPTGVYWVSRALGVSDKEFASAVNWVKNAFGKMSIFEDAWHWIKKWSSDEQLTKTWGDITSWYYEFKKNPWKTIWKVGGKLTKEVAKFAVNLIKDVSTDLWMGLLKPVVFSILEGFGIFETIVKFMDKKTYKNYARVKYGNQALVKLSEINLKNVQMTKNKKERKKYIEPVIEELKDQVDEMYNLFWFNRRDVGKQKVIFTLIDQYEEAFINGDTKKSQNLYLKIQKKLMTMRNDAMKKYGEGSLTQHYYQKDVIKLEKKREVKRVKREKEAKETKKINTIRSEIFKLAKKAEKGKLSKSESKRLNYLRKEHKKLTDVDYKWLDFVGPDMSLLKITAAGAAAVMGVAAGVGYIFGKPASVYAQGLLGMTVSEIDKEANEIYVKVQKGKSTESDNNRLTLLIKTFQEKTGTTWHPSMAKEKLRKLSEKVAKKFDKTGGFFEVMEKSAKGTYKSITDTDFKQVGEKIKSTVSNIDLENFDINKLNFGNFSMPSMAGFGSFMSFNGGQGAAFPSTYRGKRAVVYPNGSMKVGGHRNWRNNNPGNITYGKFTKSQGAIGTDGRFAIFASMEDGYKAQIALLTSSKYRNLSLTQAIYKWAPPSENNSFVYVNYIVKETRLNPGILMSSFNSRELMGIVVAMSKKEGMKAGTIVKNGQATKDTVDFSTGGANLLNNIKDAFSGGTMASIGTAASSFFGSGFNFSISDKEGNVAAQVAKQFADKGIAYNFGAGRTSEAQAGTLNGATSYDCSSFVAMVVNKTYGIPISKFGSTVATQYQFMKTGGGQYVQYNEIQPGDILFIRWDRNWAIFPGHVGIAIGNGKMVHASGGPSRGGYGVVKNKRTGVITANMPSSSQVRAYRMSATAKNHVTGTVMPTNSSDQIFVGGVGMVPNGGQAFNNLQEQLNGVTSQLLNLTGSINTIAQEQLNKSKTQLSGDIDISNCQL